MKLDWETYLNFPMWFCSCHALAFKLLLLWAQITSFGPLFHFQAEAETELFEDCFEKLFGQTPRTRIWDVQSFFVSLLLGALLSGGKFMSGGTYWCLFWAPLQDAAWWHTLLIQNGKNPIGFQMMFFPLIAWKALEACMHISIPVASHSKLQQASALAFQRCPRSTWRTPWMLWEFSPVSGLPTWLYMTLVCFGLLAPGTKEFQLQSHLRWLY